MDLQLTYDQQEFQRVRAALKEAGDKGLARELNKALKLAATEIQEAEQTGALQLPARGTVVTGLRSQIAAATAIRVVSSGRRQGVRVYVQDSQVRGKLSRETDSPRGWRHPVFGPRGSKPYVVQFMSPGWWGKAAKSHTSSVRDKVVAAMKAVEKQIAGGPGG